MNLIRIAAPAATPVSLAEAKAHLREEAGDQDALIATLIEAATQRLDGADGLLGRCLIRQTWRAEMDAFAPRIALPLPPTIAVASVEYLDAAGTLRTLPQDHWRAVGLGSLSGAILTPADGMAWPATAEASDAVRITFEAGFGAAGSNVPATIRTHILSRVAALFGVREGLPSDPKAEDDYVRAYRVWTF